MTACSATPLWRQYLSLWIPLLPTDRVRRCGGVPAEAPLAIAGRRGQTQRLIAVDVVAAGRRLAPGMPLADARAMHPDLIVAEEDAAADAALLTRLADAARRWTPLVALDEPDGLVLDVTGCLHLFGGEVGLLADVAARFARFDVSHRAGLAGTVGTAWAVARFGPARVVPAGGERIALAPLPLAALRLAPETVAALAKNGLKRVADVIDLPRAPLAARFGRGLLDRLDQAVGRAEETISPRLPAAPYAAERRFVEPIVREADVLGAIAGLANRLAAMLERHGEGARTLALDLFRADGRVVRLSLATARASRDAAAFAALFTERLAVVGEEADPGFGFDLVRLAVTAADRLDEHQSELGGADSDADLARLVDRLGARLGLRRVTRLIPHDSHIPELVVAALPAHRSPGEAALAACWVEAGAWADAAAPTRPLRLFARPEPVEAVAVVPDGPPARFRWRRVVHEVVCAEGPERIAPTWWTSPVGAPTRDYYRVEDSEGRRFWLSREGIYRETATPRWLLHGAFG